MHRKLLGLCAFLLFATFGMLSGVAGQGNPLQEGALERQEMSDEERERRQEECNTLYEACYDWCGKSNPKNVVAREQCRDECTKKLAECMKKIETNPPKKPDY